MMNKVTAYYVDYFSQVTHNTSQNFNINLILRSFPHILLLMNYGTSTFQRQKVWTRVSTSTLLLFNYVIFSTHAPRQMFHLYNKGTQGKIILKSESLPDFP